MSGRLVQNQLLPHVYFFQVLFYKGYESSERVQGQECKIKNLEETPELSRFLAYLRSTLVKEEESLKYQ